MFRRQAFLKSLTRGSALLACLSPLINLHAGPGSALQFDGVNGYVQVAHNANLNAFPFTVTAWIRSTNLSGIGQGIVSKYADASGNGWSLIMQNGNLRGFYYNGSLSSKAIDATTTTVIADGFWHHAAMTVDSSGGKLFVDGILVGSSAWTGTAGAPTGTQPVLFGRYSTFSNRFLGTMDEITLWNRALSVAELNYVKHRQLNGNEDGIVALWHLDEDGGTATADSTGHGYTGTLVSNPQWVASSAPLVFNPVAGGALQFDGANGYVQVAHTNDLDSYPFTATAWFRTTNSANIIQGIASKYADASGNGWVLVIQNNHLRGFYYRNNSLSDFAIDATSTATVADGSWHHAALTVDSSGGKLFLDGAVVGQSAWTGAAGAASTTQPLQIGRYYTGAQRFQGDIDEVTVWNRALSTNEVVTFKNLPLAGTESGLTACWRLDDASGTTAADAAGNGHAGTLISSPAWIGSTAFLGDGTSVIHTTLGSVQWTRQFAIKTIASERGFAAGAPFWVRRLDDFGAPTNNTSVSVSLDATLESALLSALVPLTNNATNFNFSLAPYLAAAPELSAGGVVQSPSLDVEPQTGAQLDSVNDTFQLTVTETNLVNSGPALEADAIALPSTPLMHFDGNLYFGAVETAFSSLANTPSRGAPSGGGISTILAVNNNSGYLVSNPAYTYGNGALLSAVLLSNGDAISSGSATLNAPSPDIGTVQNISFIRSNEQLTSTGLVANVILSLPLGLSVGFSATNHKTASVLPCGTVPLDTNLNPTNASFVFPGPLFAVEETLPYLFGAPNLTWLVGSGQIVFNPDGTSVFVREQEDAILQSQTNLVDLTATNRISNDGYFRNATPAGGSLTVTADSNGVAQVSVQLALNPPELRPHFPYAGDTNGFQIPTGTGLLSLSNGLLTAASYLTVTGPVPILYGRDCTLPGCTAAQAGATTLPFTPVGNQLGFTPDGGLFAYGSVPATNFMWGFATGTHFAQQVRTVSAGAYSMAGTFLRADQTALDDSQRASVILFSGFGDASNPSYVERPGQSNYDNGFANYSGVNFRSPAQGDSFVGQADSGWYSLDPVSKYYLRFGGVNGIHQAAQNAFPSSLMLYGYNFTFTDFGLSYLDGQNLDSVTTGAVAFPAQPSGFTQEFDRMQLTCRGDLSSASIPAGGSPKHLAYWNADFTPQSIDFHATNDDTCGTSPRFLVLGVQTTLPFISQPLHATLGFKPNGNLVCPLDNVSNVTSRFEVPAELSIQGPGTTMFTLSTAGEGYFNNWETPGAAALGTGFYSLVGKLRVPFFTDIKVQLHVTPANATTGEMDIMGGWPAPDSTDTDLGWSLNTSNYFNTVNFDPHSDGWPVALVPNITGYRNSATTQYRPRAERNWIDVAKFDYPLQFSSVLHSFSGFQDAKVELPILDVNSRLQELAPGKVDFDFAQDLSLQLPQIKELDFVNDALNGNIGPLLSVSNAIRSQLNEALDVTGINGLSQALSEDAQGFFNPILNAAIDPIVSNIYPQLAAIPQTNPQAFLQEVYNLLTKPNGELQTGISAINNLSNQASSVILTLDKTFTNVLDTAGLLNRALTKDPSTGDRQVISVIVEKLVSDQAPELGFLGSLGDDVVNPLLTDLDSTFDEIQSDIQDVSNQIAQVQMQLDSKTGDFNEALDSIMDHANDVSNFVQSAAQNVTNYLAQAITPAGDLFTANPAALQQQIRQQISTAFLSSVVAGNYQQTFRQFLGDDNFVLDQLMSTLFDQINGTIRNALTDQISGAEDGVFQNLKGAGLLGGSLLSAKIKGSPTFDGDSLRDIHLTAAIQMNMPDKMNFNAYMDIKELNSQSVPVGCIPPGSPSAEITLGAKDVPLNWAGVASGDSAQSLTLSLEARWTQQSGSVIGIGGSVDIGGGASFQGCTLKDLGASLAIGETENYFAARADATIPILGIPVNMKAGLFAGHACSLDPLIYVDPGVTNVLLNNPSSFTGVYVQYGGGLSLSDLLGLGGLGCVLDADANISTAYYYQGGASLGTIGGRQELDVKLSLLCVMSGELDVAQFLALDTSGSLTLGGSANVCGSVGPCPVCVSGCKGVTITGVISTHGIDYFVNY